MEVSEPFFVEILGNQHWDWYLSLASLNWQIGMLLSSNYAFAVVVDNKFGCFLEYVEDYIDEDKIHNTIDVVVDNIVVVAEFVLDLAIH